MVVVIVVVVVVVVVVIFCFVIFVPGALLIQEAGGMVTDMYNVPFTLRTRDMWCSQGTSAAMSFPFIPSMQPINPTIHPSSSLIPIITGEPVHSEVLATLKSVNALVYEEEMCELPDFLNVNRAKFTGVAKSVWIDRGQN